MKNNKCFVVACALDRESAPFYKQLRSSAAHEEVLFEHLHQKASLFSFDNGYHFLLITSGIGMCNASCAATSAHYELKARGLEIAAYICAGTIGGLQDRCSVGDLIVGSEYINWRADATACGCAPGQIPDMPQSFFADKNLLELSTSCHESLRQVSELSPYRMHCCLQLSADSFVTERGVQEIRRLFTNSSAADMESAAAAQVCWILKMPFVSIRSVSDLCAPEERADEEFHLGADKASLLSSILVFALFEKLSGIKLGA